MASVSPVSTAVTFISPVSVTGICCTEAIFLINPSARPTNALTETTPPDAAAAITWVSPSAVAVTVRDLAVMLPFSVDWFLPSGSIPT